MRDAPRPGEAFEGHLIEGEIGRGGMGIVLRARNVALDRLRAIKVIAPELSADPAYAERFRRESRLAASVEHPNVVPIHGAGEDDGLLFLVMRLVDGVDLHRLLDDGPLPPERAIPILWAVADGLDAAHRAGLVHRDVKPANVLIETRGGGEHVFLTDFGIAKPVSTRTAGGGERRAETALTTEGEVLGTADYVAPEQVEHGSADARSDIYSLACVAYHALTGVPPFRRDTELATLIAQTKADRPLASAANPRLPLAADQVLRDGMAIDPAQRPPTARALIERLQTALDPSEAPTPVSGRRPARATPAPAVGSERRRPAAFAGIAALAAAVAVAAVLLLGGDDGSDGSETAPEVVTRGVGKGPSGIAVGDVRVWVASREEPQLFGAPPGELDRLRRRVPEPAKQPIPLPAPRAVAIGLGRVWVVNGDALFEVGGGREPQRIAVGDDPSDVAVDNRFVWVSNEGGDSVTRVDPAAIGAGGRPQTMEVEVGDEPRSIATGKRFVWVANAGDGTVSRITPRTAHVGPPIAVGPHPTAIAAGPTAAWVADGRLDDLREIDARRSRVTGDPIPVAASPRGVAVGLSSIWVASGAEDVVERFDAHAHAPVGDPIPVGAGPADVAVGTSAVYTANRDGGSVSRIQP